MLKGNLVIRNKYRWNIEKVNQFNFHLEMVMYCQSQLYIWLSLKATVAFVAKLGAVVSF